MKEILKLDHIQKFYGNEGNVTKAIQDIDFSVQEGEFLRSEERRVGKECRSRWSPYH